MESAVSSLREHGFINYFGDQRFQQGVIEGGSTADQIGLLLLKKDWVGAVTTLLGPDPNETNESAQAARALVTPGVAMAMPVVVQMLGLFPAHKTRELLMLKALRRHGTDAPVRPHAVR